MDRSLPARFSHLEFRGSLRVHQQGVSEPVRNKAYQNLSELAAEQSAGEHWIIAIHPEDRQPALSTWEGATLDQAQLPQEVRLLRPDGSVRWVRLHIAALREGGPADVRYLHTVEDITARREAEDALHTAEGALLEQNERAQVTLDSIGDAVLTTDRPGNVTYLNRVAETLTGWSHDSAVGRPLAEVFSIVDGETRRPAVNPAERAIDENRTVELAIGCVLLRPDGTELKIEDSAAPIHDRQGHVSGAVIGVCKEFCVYEPYDATCKGRDVWPRGKTRTMGFRESCLIS